MAGGDRKTADAALIVALASGRTVQAAAESAGISERTAHRRLAERTFRRKVDAARGELYERTLGRLADASTAAVNALADLVSSGPPATRLGAARAILEIGQRLRDSVELERRVNELEERNCDDATESRCEA